MRVVKLADIPHEDMGEATPIPGWTGGSVTRTRQTIIPSGDSKNYNCSIVNFSLGSTTGWHTHDCEPSSDRHLRLRYRRHGGRRM